MNRPLSPALVSCILLLASPCAHAILDTNQNSLSDFWEKLHNNGELFPASFDPLADPDGDGWTNLEEATAGTDPFDPNPPVGIIVPAIQVTPAIYQAAPPAGDPPPPRILLAPAQVRLTWPTLAGKTYQVFCSTTLTPGSWIPGSDPFLGSGTPFTYDAQAVLPDGSSPDVIFWRVEVDDTDSDLDTLSDWEEGILGTLPDHPDTDLDGIPDSSDPLPLDSATLADPDGPGLPASLATGLIARWDLEGTYFAQSQGQYYTLARYADSAGSFPIIPFFTETKSDGMPSKAAGTTTAAAVGYLSPPRSLLNNLKTYSVSMWVKLAAGSLTQQRPLAALFTHHRRQAKPAPYQAQYRIDINGIWIERLANGTQVLKAGTYNYINYTPGTNQQINGIVTFNGITTDPQPAGTFDDGKYHHHLLVRADAIVSAYRDGQLLGTNPNVNLAAINAPNDPDTGISFGRFYGPPAELGLPYTDPQAANASFDRLRVWSRALSAADSLALFHQDIDKDGLWDITETPTRLWRDLNSNMLQESGESSFASSPLEWQPPGRDTDGDGLTDEYEQNLSHTDIGNPDTDGDLMPDGWEVDNGLDPKDPTGDNGASGDPDQDNLDNLGEYANVSNPHNPNTDGGNPDFPDAINDADEVAGGSNPNDPADGGQPLPAAERLDITLGIGDQSGSHSEDYVMNIFRLDPQTGAEIRFHTLRSGGFGQYKEATLGKFRKGDAYTFQIDWQGTNNQGKPASQSSPSEGPDFDYTFKVVPADTSGCLFLDSYDAKTKAYEATRKILAQDASDVATTQQEFEANYESRRVALLPVEVNSLDRFVRGSIDLDTVENLFGGIDNFGVQFVGTNTGQTYGEASLAEAYIHEEDYLNSEDEAAQPLESLEEKSWKQDVIFYKKDGKLHFMTTVDQVDDFEIKFFKDGEELVSMGYQLTANTEVSGLIDELDRAFGEMPFANNGEIPAQAINAITGPEYDDFFPDVEPPVLLSMAVRSSALANPFDPVEWRNLTTRCMEAVFDQLEKKVEIVAGKIAEGGEIIVKQTVGYAKGYLDGLWGGLKSDWEGIVELKELLLHPIDTSRSIYEGFEALLGLSFDEWKDISKHMLDSMMDASKQALPWDYQGDNVADQAGLVSYINGYATGFVSEQALMVYLGAGAVAKIGQTLKVIVNASKLGNLATKLASNGLNAARNLARRTKTSAQKYWSQFADSESDLLRIAANMEGSHRRPDTLGYDSSFSNAQRALGEAFEDLDDLTSEKLLKELGDKDALDSLDAQDFRGLSHVMQFQRRAAQLATTLKKANALSEDALIGFARIYKHLVKNEAVTGGGFALRERVRDLTDLFDTNLANFGSNLNPQQVKGAKALAKSLEDYKVRSEAAGFDGKFWFKDVETVYGVAYKYSNWSPSGGWSNYNGVLPNPTWCSFTKIDSSDLANDLLLLPGVSKNPKYRVEFQTLQTKDRTRLARGNGEVDTQFEPLTDDVPPTFVDAGTNQLGGTDQVIVEGAVEVDRVVDLVTGQIVWQRGN